MPMGSLGKRGAERRKEDQGIYERVKEALVKGDKITPPEL
jgi:hypothetical protein